MKKVLDVLARARPDLGYGLLPPRPGAAIARAASQGRAGAKQEKKSGPSARRAR